MTGSVRDRLLSAKRRCGVLANPIGGRVAVTALHRNAWTGHVTAVGGLNLDYPGRAGIKGKSGTVWLSKAVNN